MLAFKKCQHQYLTFTIRDPHNTFLEKIIRSSKALLIPNLSIQFLEGTFEHDDA